MPRDYFDGPALIVEQQTNTVVTADFTATVNAQDHLILGRRSTASAAHRDSDHWASKALPDQRRSGDNEASA